MAGASLFHAGIFLQQTGTRGGRELSRPLPLFTHCGSFCPSCSDRRSPSPPSSQYWHQERSATPLWAHQEVSPRHSGRRYTPCLCVPPHPRPGPPCLEGQVGAWGVWKWPPGLHLKGGWSVADRGGCPNSQPPPSRRSGTHAAQDKSPLIAFYCPGV